MKIFIDTNVLISAILNPTGTPCKAFVKAITLPNKAVISVVNIQELRRIFNKKFPAKIGALEAFVSAMRASVEIVSVEENVLAEENLIRDVNDRPILRAALKAGADIILTGDKDFLEANLLKPIAITLA